MLEWIRNLLIFLVVFCGLILFHELGHFLAARYFGVRVTEFGIGFPPRMLRLGKWRETEFTLNWLPFGGFVRPAGEDDPAVPNGLASAPPLQRIVVLAAGSLTNVLVAFLLFWFGFTTGWPDTVVVARVEPNSPAAAAGLQADDVVQLVGDTSIHTPQQLADITYANLGQTLTLQVERAGENLKIDMTPRESWPAGQGPLGIGMTWKLTTYNMARAGTRAATELANQAREVFMLPVRLVRQQVDASDLRFVGPVGIKAINDQAVNVSVELGAIFPLLQFVGIINLMIAITNLLPLPALDGGRIIFVLLELLRGRRIAPETEGRVHFIGMALLITLMVVLVYQDISNPLVLQ